MLSRKLTRTGSTTHNQMKNPQGRLLLGIQFHYFLSRYYSSEETNDRNTVNILIYGGTKWEK